MWNVRRWEDGSYAYHGDDGKKFLGNGMGEPYGPTFGTGDTVGAGIHMGRQELFFTKNGSKLKPAHRPVRTGLYPTIGLHSKGELVQVNFGAKPFVFDLEGMLAEEKAAQRAAIESLPVSPGVSHQLVRQYLLHHGYQDTLAAFDEAAGLAEQAQAASGSRSSATTAEAAVAAASLPLRARIRRAIVSGDVDGALALLASHSPALLADAARFGDVHFQLACQKYIEHVRAGRVQEAVLFAQGSLAALRGPSSAAVAARLRDVVALVAYQQPETSPLAHLMGQAQREALADEVNAAVLDVLTRGTEPVGSRAVDSGSAGGAAAGLEPSSSCGAEGEGMGEEGRSGVDAAALLRPSLAGPHAAAAGEGGARPVSQVESLLRQLVAVQTTLHEVNGGQGGMFLLREHMLGPGT
ncbi:hypothetical protein GPECTOR_5g234 [Gonium pectorale]|uniref:B30.2/SPRY domain-containing protein n=1 Tax=Gonium pectorale TaxID=33097 RepID=A0A150GWF4_GONPE|nr:hypothetical protein GPECTOR_5g234 [Gonium pectorale]|eukprot:KXZ54134.1 hypothetical protein GPECTOR_5g234 [Gonium pectorale]